MSLGWNRESVSGRSTVIGDKIFYTELLGVITRYMEEYGKSTPSRMLQSFVSAQYTCEPIGRRGLKAEGCLSVDEIIINSFSKDKTGPDILEAENVSAIYFTEEIRYLILKAVLRGACPEEKSTLIEAHMWIHLLELHLINEISVFEKMNKFLNTNFRLNDGDFIGHACRRNFSEILKMRPELESAIEDLIPILDSEFLENEAETRGFRTASFSEPREVTNSKRMKALEEWKAKHHVCEELYTIVSGKHTQFLNIYESCCYDLAYKGQATAGNQYLDVLNGRLDNLIDRSSGWILLVVLLSVPKMVNLKELELTFEAIFHDVLKLDHLTALGFLAYSRAVDYYFTIFITQMPLNNVVASALVSFAVNAGISPLQVVEKYARQLQNECKYNELCSWITKNSISGFCYSKETILYFIKNFKKYEAFVEEPFLTDKTNKFIFWAYKVQNADYQTLVFLLGHPYSYLILVDLIDCVLGSPCSDEALLIAALKCISNSKADKTLVKELKAKVAKQLVENIDGQK
ncbi:hypothetical protein PAEPH01_0063 [Pancytospora epiphaga]|nr:hypothetical protein PAEPH01_0063 [Pancytospora epiphaga]